MHDKSTGEPSGVMVDYNLDKQGGISVPATQEGVDQTVYVNGKDYNQEGSPNTNEVKDEKGKPLKQDAADVLMHEVIGHGIPKLLGESQGVNAVEEENKVRQELKSGRDTKRQEDPAHKACQRCKYD